MKSIDVLLIEDSPSYVALVRSMLADTRIGTFNLVCADDLATGLQQIAENSFDAVLLDLTLPDCQGLETLANIQARAGEIPVVVLTSLDDETLALTALQNGAADYLVKSEVNGNWIARSLLYAAESPPQRPAPQKAATAAGAAPKDLAMSAPADHLQIEKKGDLAVARLLESKIVGQTTLDEMKQKLFRLVNEESYRKLLLNFSRVEYVSNAALGLLLSLLQKMSAAEGRLILCNLSPEVYEHFATRKLNELFEIHPEEQVARNAFN